MLRYPEIARPKSGAKSAIVANVMLAVRPSQRTAESCFSDTYWPASSSVDGFHDALRRDNRDLGGQRKDMPVLDRDAQQGPEPRIFHVSKFAERHVTRPLSGALK